MRYFAKRFRQSASQAAEPATRRFDDGREVCLGNTAGRAEYQSRKQQLWQQQSGCCAEPACGLRMSLDDARLTGGDWQEPPQQRDDRLERNKLVHKRCLAAWHRRRGGSGSASTATYSVLTAALLVALLWLTPTAARAQAANAAAISGQVVTASGTPAANARVRVCQITAVGTPCSTGGVSLYSDYNLTVPTANPIATDSYGNYAVFTTSGLYLLQVTPQTGLTYNYYFSAGGAGGGGTGTVTSVGLALPASTFTVSGSPVTTSGTLTGAFATQAANMALLGPASGADAAPTWRLIVPGDLPFTYSGNTTELATVSGAATTGDCAVWNSSGNLVSMACGGAPGGASGQLQTNNGSGGFSAYSTPGVVAVEGGGATPTPATLAILTTAFGGSTTPSSTSQVLAATSSSTADWRQLTADDILPGFTISSFGCVACTTVEIGATVSNPAFTASYSSTPASAAITNTDGISSPTNLTTPFTSGTVTGSFTHTTATSTTFTLTAVSTSTQTATKAITWVPRAFGGTGTGGSATGATASGNNAVLVGATGTLSISYLGSSCTGQVYNVTTSGTQYVYLLLPCNVSNPGSGSFTTPGPTVFAMGSPTTITFVNQYGVSLATEYLYRSVNSSFDGTNYIITVGD